MKDELITYPTAILAKDKGFDIPTTQSLLQRWLRDKHNIHIDVKIDLILENGKYGYRVFKYPVDNIDEVPLFTYKSETYEQALEIGLQEALKLI